jgi:signal transduction histidine kinase
MERATDFRFRIKQIMRSIALKLTLAFLLVGLTGSLLVAVIFQQRTRAAFDEFIRDRDQQELVDNLVGYYQTNAGWEGVGEYLRGLIYRPQQKAEGGPGSHREWMRYSLVGPDRRVFFSFTPGQVGQQVSDRDLKRAVPLKAGSEITGWLLPAPLPREWVPDSPEDLFLRNVNTAALLSALVAAVMALSLGSLLAFTMTRTLRELTEATVEIARGRLGRLVKVRSKDELGQLATAFNQMSTDLARATLARRQMTADIAHDLRSPLSVISGYAEALSDGKLPGNAEVYGILYQETRHLSRLVEDLRLLSLADAGELPRALQTAQPVSILERVAARHAVAAQEKGIALRVEAAPDLPLISVDVERMAQVLDNLVLNAFRYTPRGGEIILAVKAENETVQMQVRDNGSGISADDLPYIFDRFYKGDKSRQQIGESGLGLAISKSIVEALGGTISVQSTPGIGASFEISLRTA